MPDLASLCYAALPLFVALAGHWARHRVDVLDIDGVHVAGLTAGVCWMYVEGLKGKVPGWGCVALIVLAVAVAMAGLVL